jgi:hypothetical protein
VIEPGSFDRPGSLDGSGPYDDSSPLAGRPPSPSRPRSRRRRLLSWLAGLLALALAATAVLVALHLRASGSGAAPQPSPPVVTATATTPAPTTADPDQVRLAALDALLADRSRAVLEHDSARWMATVDPGAATFGKRQQAQIANLVKLPLSRWHYRVVGTDQLSTARQAALGPDAWLAEVDLTYRFGSADRADVHSTQYLTLTEHDGSWLVANDRDGRTATEIWDLGPLTVLKGKSSVVIGLSDGGPLASYVSQADSAVTRVSGIWGTDWPRRVVVLVPKTQAQMGQLLDRSSGSLGQIAAVTTGELTAAEGAPAGGADQIIVNPAGFAKLGSLGRRVVMTHEATHVAVRASTPRQVSIWLSEGFADYIGYSGLDLPRTEVAADVLGLVRRGTGPKHLPGAVDFDATQSTIGPSYSASWLACELISDRYGAAKLLAFYRAAAGATKIKALPTDATPDEATTAAFRAGLGVTEAGFTKIWLAYLTTLSRQ